MLDFSLVGFDFRRRVALVIWLIGVGGGIYSFHIQPENYNIVFDTAKWIFVRFFRRLLSLLVGLGCAARNSIDII